MKKSQIDARVYFHMVIRPIPETSAYSVTLGEIQDGQFVPTTRRPNCCDCDWDEVKPNPLAPGQAYVSASDLHTLIFNLAVQFEDCSFYPNMLVFKVKDFPVNHEESQEETEE